MKITKGFIQITQDANHPDGRRKLMLAGGEILDPPLEADNWVKGGLAEWVEVEEQV